MMMLGLAPCKVDAQRMRKRDGRETTTACRLDHDVEVEVEVEVGAEDKGVLRCQRC